jgi:guanylate kinase
MNKGKLYIISAPSGAGKTSLVKRLTTELDKLMVSISHTTRTQREGEIHGRDYFFVVLEEFQRMQANDAFLESARVFDNFYGTARQTVEDHLLNGFDVILEIDWQGAQQMRNIMPDSISVFIFPPSTAILHQRLKNRAQDSEEVIARRMREAVTEISHYREFDYLVVNDVFGQALVELKSIIVAQRLQKNRSMPVLKNLIDELLNS